VQLRVPGSDADRDDLAASSVASTSAVLNASINANYVTTRAWFEWAPDQLRDQHLVTLDRQGRRRRDHKRADHRAHRGHLYHFRAVATNSLAPITERIWFQLTNTQPPSSLGTPVRRELRLRSRPRAAALPD